MRNAIIAIMVATLGSVSQEAYSQARYDNPVDGRSYMTEGQFRTYKPEKPRDTTGQKVVTNSIHLLTGDPELRVRISVDDLASFIKSAEARAYPILAKNETPALILLQFNCQPSGHEVKIASQGSPKEAILRALYDAMKSMPPLRTKGEVIFQIELNVRS